MSAANRHLALLTRTIEVVNSSLDLQEVMEAIAHEVVAAVALARHHCRVAPKVLRPTKVALPIQPHRSARIERRPHGVVLAIAPWNLPFIIPLSQVLPSLLAGNAVILKPSS